METSREHAGFHSVFDRDYWLARCEGFQVVSPDGRAGIVEEVRYASRQDRPDILVVRSGLFGRRVLLIAVEEVEDILPREERVTLRRREA